VIVFGPVPSRRLGRSLGVNNIPPKVCSYSCVYCQLGRTQTMKVEQAEFYEPALIWQEVQDKLGQARDSGETVDYLTFVPDGEPTLDARLGEHIGLLRQAGIPIAVISNSSLVQRSEVREVLAQADWVSLKVDAVDENTWRRVDRPHGQLRLSEIMDGAREFARTYQGELVTETMLVAGLNDEESQLKQVADYLGQLGPAISYLSVPTRPPAEEWVRPPSENALNRAYQLVAEKVERVEYLIGYEGNAFSASGDLEKDLLSITAVHPMRAEAVQDLVMRGGGSWQTVEELLERRCLVKAEYAEHTFYLRRPNSG